MYGTLTGQENDHVEVKGVIKTSKGILCPQTDAGFPKSQDYSPCDNQAWGSLTKGCKSLAGAQLAAVRAPE